MERQDGEGLLLKERERVKKKKKKKNVDMWEE